MLSCSRRPGVNDILPGLVSDSIDSPRSALTVNESSIVYPAVFNFMINQQAPAASPGESLARLGICISIAEESLWLSRIFTLQASGSSVFATSSAPRWSVDVVGPPTEQSLPF